MRVKTSKTKNSESIYILKSFRVNGKSTSKVIKKLGTVASNIPSHGNNRDEVITWAKSEAKRLTDEENNNARNVIVEYSQSKLIEKNVNRLLNGGYIFIKDIYYQLGLDEICKRISSNYKVTYDLDSILSNLIFARILEPSSKKSTYDYIQTLIEKPNFNLHHIYRSLSLLAKEKDLIEAAVYQNSSKVINRNTNILYYDCTNFYFEIEEAEGLKQYGKSKEHRPNPIVQMGLFMDGNGLPLAFDINPGNQNEQPTLIPIEKRIMKDFSLSKFIVCTDAGLASTTNRKFNDKKDKSFVVTQSLKQTKSFIKDWALDKEGWTLNGNPNVSIADIDESECIQNIYYKERWIKENGIEQRLIVSYSPKYARYQRSVRNKQIDRAKNDVEKGKVSKTNNPNSHRRFEQEVNTTKDGEIAKEKHIELDTKKIAEEEKYDGFYAVCTTLEDDVQEIVKINSRRWEIEYSFRIMKTEFEARPVFVKRDDRIIAHFITCFLALLIYRIIEKKLEDKYTVEQISKTLKDMKFNHIKGEGYIPLYKRTDITDSLHEKFGYRTDYEITTEKRMKKILRDIKRQ